VTAPFAPDAEAVALPLLPPLQETFTTEPMDADNVQLGSVIVRLPVAVQPFASVTVTE
jgi:hypothetical protein